MFESLGTERWFAPELCFDLPQKSSFGSDVWAYGCIILEITSQQLPWRDKYENNRVLTRSLSERKNASIFEKICREQAGPEELRALLCRCCTWEKANRPNFQTIIQNLSEFIDSDRQNKNESSTVLTNTEPQPKQKKGPKSATSLPVRGASINMEDFEKEFCDVLGLPELDFPPKKERRPSAKPAPEANIKPDKKFYDQNSKRYVYEGPGGGFYYLADSGEKRYIEKAKRAQLRLIPDE